MAKRKTKKSTRNVVHVIISIIYIIWGINSPLSVLKAIINLDMAALLGAAVGVVTLIAGILGLFQLKPAVRRVLGVIIFILAALTIVTSLSVGGIHWQSLIQGILQAILAWLYIIW